MQSENKLFEDFTKFVNGAAGTLAGMGREAEMTARAHFRDWIGGLDFVSRDEFEAVKAMAAAARDDVVALTARLDDLAGEHSVSSATTSLPPEAKSPMPKPPTA